MQHLGRYELLGEIAAGGMAKVYLGRVVGEGGFEREVAIKLMHEHIATDPEFVAMFLDEARLAARIRHPHVVPTVDVQRTDQGLFLVMEFIEGLSLDSLIRQQRHKGGHVPLEFVVRILVDTLQGLHAAHKLTDRNGMPLNLVHRDVSPANILVGSDGVSRITDFGVARAEARLSSTRGGHTKGKLPYMAPEQIMDRGIDCRSDVYAAGVVLWEALTSHRLFTGDSEGAVLQKVLAGASTTPRQENPDVPEVIDRACMRSLAVDIAARFGTALEMADALEEAAQAAGVKIATEQRLAAYVGGFETNAERIAEARKMAPGEDSVESAPRVVTSPSGAALGAVHTPSVRTPTSDSTPFQGPPTTATATTIPSGVHRDEPKRASGRRYLGLVIGIAAALLVGGVGAWLGGRDESHGARHPADRAGPTESSPAEQGSVPAGPATSTSVATAAESSTASAPIAAQSSASAAVTDASSAVAVTARPLGSAVAVPSGRAPQIGTAQPSATRSSVSKYLPVTL